jgi:leader peptidase (prepilin peptidase)/N-methyltransferase
MTWGIDPAALPWVLGAFGLVVGSFLGVCAYRLPREQSIVRPPSACENCGYRLAWSDNIPVLSYAAFRGRCRKCGASISPVYPVMELVTAIVFAAAAATWAPGWLLTSRLVLAAILIVLFVIDLQHRILPNVITLPGIVVGFLFSLVTEPGWFSSLVGIVAGGGVLLLIAEAYFRWRNEHGLGMGDVKMLGMLGAFLGWKLMLLTLVLSSFLGSFAGLALMATGRGNMKYALPFGSFLTAGALVAMFAGEAILRWYFGFYPEL